MKRLKSTETNKPDRSCRKSVAKKVFQNKMKDKYILLTPYEPFYFI